MCPVLPGFGPCPNTRDPPAPVHPGLELHRSLRSRNCTPHVAGAAAEAARASVYS